MEWHAQFCVHLLLRDKAILKYPHIYNVSVREYL